MGKRIYFRSEDLSDEGIDAAAEEIARILLGERGDGAAPEGVTENSGPRTTA